MKKIVIEIADDDYNRINSYPDGKTFYPITARLYKAVKDGTPIPDNATNGEIVQMIFPYYSYERNDYVQSTEDYIVDSMECMEHDLYFSYDWWNAPYIRKENNNADNSK